MNVEVKYSEIKKEVADKISHCRNVLSAIYGFPIPGIVVNFKLKGTKAGVFCVKTKKVGGKISMTCEIKLNSTLMLENKEEFIENTIPHEFCHYVTFLKKLQDKNPDKKYSVHGPVWKQMMRDLGLEPDRCHQYDVESVKKKVKRHIYTCACDKEMKISSVVHNRIRQGRKYICKTCKQTIQDGGSTVLN